MISRACVALLAVAAMAVARPARSNDEITLLDSWPRWARIYALTQTPDGYIWVGTSSGLVRFDGVRFVSFGRGTTPSLPSNDVRALAPARDGGLWIGLDEGAGLYRWRHGALAPVDTGNVLANTAVRALAELSDRSLWIATNSALLRKRPGTMPALVAENSALGGRISSLYVTGDQRLLIAGEGGVRVWDGRSLSVLADGVDVRALASDPRGVLVLAGEQGLLRLQPGGAPAPWVGADASAWGPARTAVFDTTGALVAGFTRALVRWQGERPQVLAPGNGDFLLIDHEGSSWVGRTGGLLRRFGRPRVTVRNAETDDSFVNSVIADADGGVWVGSNRRVRHFGNGGTQEVVLEVQGVRSMARGRVGVMWLGTHAGLFRHQNGRVEAVALAPKEAGGPDPRMAAMLEDDRGTLWLGGRYGGLWSVQAGVARAWPQFAQRCPDSVGPPDCPHTITALLQDGRGGLWVGTRRDGLHHLIPATQAHRRLGRADGMSSERVLSLLGDLDGTLWVGTEGGGVVRVQDDRAAGLGPDAGLPSANVHGMVEDGAGNLWMGSEVGVFRARKRDLEGYFSGHRRRVDLVTFDRVDGVSIQRVPQGYQPVVSRDRAGRLWFATSNGIAIFAPPEKEPPVPAPRVLLEEVRLDGRPLRLQAGSSLTLPTGRGTLEIQYTAPSFVAPNRIRFRYRMQGLDEGWTDARERRTAYYQNLPPGTYSFLVRASSDDLDWSRAEASLPLSVPRVYERPVFYVSAVFGLILLGLAGHRLRLTYLRGRFGAVLDERNRIARDLHDSLAQYLTGIGYQLERLARQAARGQTPELERTLEDTKAMVRRCRLEARQAIWNLRAHDLEGRSLGENLTELAKQLRLGTDARVTVEMAGRERTLPPEAQAELMRIVQEASTNALVHGRASAVIITLTFAEDHVLARIHDDGSGFNPNEDGDGAAVGGMRYGLVGMRERADKLGATLTVDSQPGQGTRVEVRVPARET